MEQSIQAGRDAEAKSNFSTAVDCYRTGRRSLNEQSRHAAVLGLLRIYERGKEPAQWLTLLGWALMAVTLLVGAALMLSALPSSSAFGQRSDKFMLIAGGALLFSGVIWSSLLIGAGRALQLLELMELRQACERDARLRGECGQPDKPASA